MTTDVSVNNLKINVLTRDQYDATTPSSNELYFVEDNEKHTWLIAVTDTAPTTASSNDRYYNTTDKKIYTWNGSSWTNAVTPSENDLYIDKSSNFTYAWNGTDLIQVGGGGGITTDDIDNTTITLNESSKLQAAGTVNKNTSGGQVYNWVGTKAEYNALTEIHDDWLYYITDDNSSSGNTSLNNVLQRLNRAYAWTSHNINGAGNAYCIGYNGSKYFSSNAISGKTVVGDSAADLYCGSSYYCIVDGKLYYKTMTSSAITLTQIGSDNTWTALAGQSHSSASVLAINNGDLYYVNGSTSVTLVDSDGWQKISWKSSNTTLYGYGIKNDNLYKVCNSGSTITLLDSSGVWTSVSGKVESSSGYAFGIKDGKLYSISSSGTLTQLGSDNTWTQISGYDTNYSQWYIFGLGICDGALYTIKGNNVYLVNNTETWVKCCGYSPNANELPFAITQSGKLYKISGSGSYVYTATQIGTDTTWTDISSYGTYSLGINNGNVYTDLTSPTQLTTIGGFTKVYGCLNRYALYSGCGIYWTGSVTDDAHTVYTVPSPEKGYTEYSDVDMTIYGTVTSTNTSNNTITDDNYTYTRDSSIDSVFNGVSADSKNQLLSVADLIAAIKG